MIFGNTEGIRNTILDKLEDMYNLKVDRNTVCSNEIIDIICKITEHINREISVAIDRKGNIVNIALGDNSSVEMPIMDIKEKRLSGIRIIHTHPNGNPRLSNVDISALLKLRLDCIGAIGVNNGEYKHITLGFCTVENDKLLASITEVMDIKDALNLNIIDIINSKEEIFKNSKIYENHGERAVLVGIESQEDLIELEELAKACNVQTLGKVMQNRTKIDKTFFVGQGKVEEIAMRVQTCNANVVIFDDELSASQIRNLENAIGAKVIDRTTLILDIFAKRAKSREAKIQVELAQLKYRLPRLIGMGSVLSRTGGGIGTRGPGEKKLETDKRHIKSRIYDLVKELDKIKKTRQVQRNKRSRENIPRVSLVGYTNAGKSTLRNKLCDIASPKDISKQKVFEADMLFATLDVTTRSLNLPDNRLITLTDTVGFVRKLPHDLVEAFKSTLEEVINSELLIHVVDASSLDAVKQIKTVNNILKELGAEDKPMIILLNKIDKAAKDNIKDIKNEYKGKEILEISAKDGTNLDNVLKTISKKLPNTLRKAEYLIPYSDTATAAVFHRSSKILKQEYKQEGIHLTAMVDEEIFNKYKKYATDLTN